MVECLFRKLKYESLDRDYSEMATHLHSQETTFVRNDSIVKTIDCNGDKGPENSWKDYVYCVASWTDDGRYFQVNYLDKPTFTLDISFNFIERNIRFVKAADLKVPKP